MINTLQRAWKAWLRFGHWIGEVMSWVWMPLFYFVIAMPFALVVRFVSDPLRVRCGPKSSYWEPKKLPPLDLAWAKSQGSVTHESPTLDTRRSTQEE